MGSKNQKVTFFTEKVLEDRSRYVRIAKARNEVLSEIRKNIDQYKDYKYLVMVDLDFLYDWPIDEIVSTINSQGDWDCVSANGLEKGLVKNEENIYYDRLAFRNEKFPFGPEVIGKKLWFSNLKKIWFSLKDNSWIPVYSAFGGLAIYKTATIISFSYSGRITEDLKKYYQKILQPLSAKKSSSQKRRSIQFKEKTCCEHLTLHASMAMHGYNKMYVNPLMIIHRN